ncbi:hypothetical protein ACFY2Q_27365 [Micromonospora sp. NPDC000316]|uniref:hypothetical protein n=1 Tax=Micromonospora sp. NPDC000316 TaxID=3364216 RepID=UPI003678A465
MKLVERRAGRALEVCRRWTTPNCDHPANNAARKRCRRKISSHLKAKRGVKYVGVGRSGGPADLPITPADGLSATSFLHLPLASTAELLISFPDIDLDDEAG